MANVENIWNGRPISKILLREPLEVEPHVTVDLIELLPPPHQRTYKMGLEHVGVVVGDGSTSSPGPIGPPSPASSSRAKTSSRTTSCSRTSPT